MSGNSGPLFFPDRAGSWTAAVVEQEQLARDTWRIRIDAPALARQITPGQFVMIRMPNMQDPLLGRPFALYDTVDDSNGENRFVDIVYLVKGKLTSQLVKLVTGQNVEVVGPLGNGFVPAVSLKHVVFIAGGIGQTPFVAYAKELTERRSYGDPPRSSFRADRITICYGARSADWLAGLTDFENAGCELQIATDDGSAGHHGLVTELLAKILDSDSVDLIVTCGPEPMMAAVATMALANEVDCEVSLETPMACGIGACFSCVVPVRQADGDWDYKRTCVEGPVFPADRVIWDTE